MPDGSRERFASRDLWHVAGMGRGLVGLNPVTFMRDAFGAALSTGEYAARFWSNDAKPAVVLTTDQKVPRETKGEIRRDWDALHAGASRAHGTAVLDHNLKPQFMSHDNEKSQFLDTRVFQVVEVARIWGVPPHLLFELSKATFSNIEQQSLEFVTYHLGPHYERVAQAATKAFAAPGCYFEFLVDALVKGDLKSRWEAYRIQRETGVVSADEIATARTSTASAAGPAQSAGAPPTCTSAAPIPSRAAPSRARRPDHVPSPAGGHPGAALGHPARVHGGD
ncbi:phage portal protein [Teichococcus aestuarii]|uniref:phage portal protein n=1 Tax=Teichococcus aestuarii TaxID=568898 RepID=UPI00361BA030